jgi:RNA polymerase sigma-70 factor (ECF subfamily)
MFEPMNCALLPAGQAFSPRVIAGMKPGMERETATRMDARHSNELERLLAAVERGDPAALRELYRRTSAKLYGICLRVLADEGEAQDVLQEVYTRVWAKAGTFDPAKAGAITWLSVLARNKAIDRLRARRAPGASLDDAAAVPSGEPSQLEVLEQAEDARRLRDCLDEIDERARAMIRSAFFDGASYPELAQREEVPLATMKSWIRRGLMRLRGCLER